MLEKKSRIVDLVPASFAAAGGCNPKALIATVLICVLASILWKLSTSISLGCDKRSATHFIQPEAFHLHLLKAAYHEDGASTTEGDVQRKHQTHLFSAQPENSNITSNITQHVDPEATDCSELLKKFRADDIEVAKKASDAPVHFRRSFVTLAKDDITVPFYIATHDGAIDPPRSSIMKYQRYYERQLTQRIRETFEKKKLEGKQSIFLDVGANIGWFSLVAAAHGATKVYSFEPNLQNTIRFCESLVLNGWASGELVSPISKGAGKVEEQRNLFGRRNPGAYSFKRTGAVVGNMQITTLDGFAERHGWFGAKPSIGFFKLDVEYFEQEVMEGAEKLIKSHIIEMIALELKRGHTKVAKLKICTILLDAGYEFWMHGTWMGPREITKTTYTNAAALVDDLQVPGKYGENVLFRLKGL